MAAHLSFSVSRSRPPVAHTMQRARDVAPPWSEMDVAFALAIALEAYGLDSIIVLDAARHVVASAGRTAIARTLSSFAKCMSEGEPVGSARTFDEGRVHVEVVSLAGAPCVVALRGQVALDDPEAITRALHASFALDSEPDPDREGNATADDDFEFDLGWGDSASL